MTRRVVYLHVGAPKTGTTYLQAVVGSNRDVLASRGVFVPGRNHVDHFRAGFDLRGLEKDPRDPHREWKGAWDELATEIRQSEHEISVVSDERLSSCTSEQAQRAVSSLAPVEVRVIYVTRDPAGLLSAEWQEHVKHGDRRSFDAWLDDTLDPKGHEWYWKVHGVGDVLRRWGAAVPVNRMYVLTLPPKGSDPELLWQRFCSILHIDPEGVDTDVRANVSLGVEGAELLRRVNEVMPEEFPRWHHVGVTRDVLAHRILAPRTEKTSINVPERLADQVGEYTARLIDDIKNSGVQVVGDLEELNKPVKGGGMPKSPNVAATAVGGIAGLLVHVGSLNDELREVRGNLTKSRNEHKQARAELAKVRNELKETRDQLKEVRGNLKETRGEVKQVREELRQTRKLLADERSERKTAVRRATKAENVLAAQRQQRPWQRIKRCVVEVGEQSRMVGGPLKAYRKLRRRDK
ncbi:MAG: hypothetical protein GEV00_04885 [Actinophytocola sp.]|nr:hypothetical protein [Actinophytocola sp.]